MSPCFSGKGDLFFRFFRRSQLFARHDNVLIREIYFVQSEDMVQFDAAEDLFGLGVSVEGFGVFGAEG